MGSSKDYCSFCGKVRGDNLKYKLQKIQSASLIDQLNKMNPSEFIIKGMLVCTYCSKKSYSNNDKEKDRCLFLFSFLIKILN